MKTQLPEMSLTAYEAENGLVPTRLYDRAHRDTYYRWLIDPNKENSKALREAYKRVTRVPRKYPEGQCKFAFDLRQSDHMDELFEEAIEMGFDLPPARVPIPDYADMTAPMYTNTAWITESRKEIDAAYTKRGNLNALIQYTVAMFTKRKMSADAIEREEARVLRSMPLNVLKEEIPYLKGEKLDYVWRELRRRLPSHELAELFP